MFFLLSKLLDVFLSPFCWGLVFLAAAVPWRPRKAARLARRKRIFGAVGLGILVVCATQPVSNAITRHLEDSAHPSYHPDVVYDAVVLLGGVVDEEAMARSGQVSYNENVERLTATFELLRQDRARVAIISGAPIDPQHPQLGEAVVLIHQLEAWGIGKERLVLEDRARNTRENALYTAEIVRARGYEKVLIVTSAFHMARAKECFNAVGLDVDALAVDYRAHEHAGGLGEWMPRAGHLAITSAMLRELAGRFIYRLQGYGKALP